MVRCTAKIDCVDMSTCSASAYMEESVHMEKVSSKPLMFSIADLERKFHMGDNVRVLNNSTVAPSFKGKTGMVVQIDEDTVVVHDQSSQCQVCDSATFTSLLTFPSSLLLQLTIWRRSSGISVKRILRT